MMETLLYMGCVACYDPAHLFGWLFTAAAVSLGAPFWFDLLSRVAKLRGPLPRRGGSLSSRPVGGLPLFPRRGVQE